MTYSQYSLIHKYAEIVSIGILFEYLLGQFLLSLLSPSPSGIACIKLYLWRGILYGKILDGFNVGIDLFELSD